jgi:hypothetical protein
VQISPALTIDADGLAELAGGLGAALDAVEMVDRKLA